ncbi:MAG: 16S rRNA (cytosine(1402)-N(4))-methyltransferase RsmH [Bacteroidia bacterium]|nr:16S rRNA (cytosine(1402)-N(4))-methyltransferase RsmH [Bacteroidia bacterium]MDW8300925.1 16S rRNA (cytosine(1402)-N(4))-methyltransferase RsmH [Bacteroidia bacterium]
MFYHVPVLLSETVQALVHNFSGIYVDATFGGGGHAQAILNRLTPEGKLIAFDQDKDVPFEKIPQTNFYFVHTNFANIGQILSDLRITSVDGILADLGVSSYQIDTAARGFSFRFDAPLDMRMNQDQFLSAVEVVNTYPSEKLYSLFKLYGEVHNPKLLTECIIQARKLSPIKTTFQLIKAIQKAAPKFNQYGYYAQVFQAIRIEVNQELENLKTFLYQSIECLKSKGRLVVLTYHSLEDRIVKNIMRYGNADGKPQKDTYGNLLRPLVPIQKPILPTESEIQANPRARSAKLRVAEKI